MTDPTTSVAPSDTPRQSGLDALRGLALGGILVVNIQWFSSIYLLQGLLDPAHTGDWDQALRWITTALFQGKFYAVFSFLFGYSLVLHLQRLPAHQGMERARRRQKALMILGLIHGLLLFPGDILLTYGVLGWLMLNWQHWLPAKRVKVAVVVWLVTSLVWAVLALLSGQMSLPESSAQELQELAAQMQAAQQVVADGGWPMHQRRLQDWLEMTLIGAVVGMPSVLPWMLLGSAAALAPKSWQSWPSWPWMALAAVLGLGGAMAYAGLGLRQDVGSHLVYTALLGFFGPPLTLTYMGLFMRLSKQARQTPLLLPLAQAGRMSLTLYLSQSLICALLFTGYGLGWVGQLTFAQTMGTAVLIYGAQVWAAHWWLTRYSTGPLEALMQRWLSRPQPPSP